jgi:cytochrome P450/nitrite reductase/ring-hydroxylating ferredoxin subunit
MATRAVDIRAKDHADASAPTWSRVAEARELRGDGPHTISAGGTDLVLLRTSSGLRVYEGRCPHQGALLGEGEMEGETLVCRNHRWRFDAQTGRRMGGAECLRACPVREEGGELFVDVSGLGAASLPAASVVRSLDELPGPRAVPIFGNALQMDPDRVHVTLEQWAAKYGPTYVARLGARKILVLSDPEVAAAMYRARPETYRRPSELEPIFEELRVSGVFSAEGEGWRAQRRLAMEALSLRHLRGFYPTLAHVARRFVRRWTVAADAGRELEVADELKRFTVDVTTQLVFGHDLNTLEKGDQDIIQRHLEHIFPAFARRLNAIFPYWRYFRLPIDRRVDRAVDAVYAWLTEVVAQARARLAADPARAENPANFIEAMLVARDAEGRPFSDEVIFGNGLTMLLAGEDTTAYTLAWAVHHLCDVPEAVAALRREADATFAGEVVPVDIEQANRLAYAAAVANESMRLRPVAPNPLFEPTTDVVLAGVAVPKGTLIVTLARQATLDPARFDTPQTFAPERWIEAGANGKAHDASVHVPFGSGPRICPGRSLAILEMRVALGAIYKNFDVERVGATADVRERLAFTLGPVGLRVKVRRRAAS